MDADMKVAEEPFPSGTELFLRLKEGQPPLPAPRYHPDAKTEERIQNDYRYHPPKPDQLPRYEMIRSAARGMAWLLACNCPVSRELSVALTHLEQVVMMSNAAIARNE